MIENTIDFIFNILRLLLVLFIIGLPAFILVMVAIYLYCLVFGG